MWPVWLFATSWMGEDVYGVSGNIKEFDFSQNLPEKIGFKGNPDAAEGSVEYNLYLEGVHAGSLANSMFMAMNVR